MGRKNIVIILLKKSLEGQPPGRLRKRWENNIRKDLGEISHEERRCKAWD
jgi:hypothetical protein